MNFNNMNPKQQIYIAVSDEYMTDATGFIPYGLDRKLLQLTYPDRRIIKFVIPKKEANVDWRNNYKEYLDELEREYNRLCVDQQFINDLSEVYPHVDIILSLKRCKVTFWATSLGWENKKKHKTVNIDWESTFKATIKNNLVSYGQNGSKPNFTTGKIGDKNYTEQF